MQATAEIIKPKRGRPKGSGMGDDLQARSIRFKKSTFEDIDRAYIAVTDLPQTAKITKQSFIEILVKRGLESVLAEVFEEKNEKQSSLFPLKSRG